MHFEAQGFFSAPPGRESIPCSLGDAPSPPPTGHCAGEGVPEVAVSVSSAVLGFYLFDLSVPCCVEGVHLVSVLQGEVLSVEVQIWYVGGRSGFSSHYSAVSPEFPQLPKN